MRTDYERERPFNWVICDRCRGHGKHVNPNIDGHGLSREDFDEDPDFAEDYFSGVYDVACHECRGAGKVKVPDVSRMTFAEKREYVLELRDERESRADDNSERWMRYAETGCMG
jgi:RecJ-like exonuclease